MRARLVTGYVPIPGHPRGPDVYGELGEKLGGVPVPKKAFYMRVEDTWLHQYVRSLKMPLRVSEGDNPVKNTLAYHCVNHQKTEWLKQAAEEYPEEDVVVWVDYGIFHQPGVTAQAIYEFIHCLDDKAIYAPGCWDKQPVESVFPSWRFCGSVLAVPTKLASRLDFEVKATARQHIQATKNVEWEVNTWARLEQRKGKGLPWRWYKADHDVSQFTNLLQLPEASHEPA